MLNVKRQELKYQMQRQEANLLKARISSVMQKDPHASQGPYFIRSLYFDNKSSISLVEKVEGFERRKKYRIRFYDFQSEIVKFEIKQKIGDVIVKQGAAIKRSDLAYLIRGNYDCLLSYDNPILRKIYYDFKRDYFTPVVVVDYCRDAYALDFNHIRVTFDTRLKKSGEVEDCCQDGLSTIPVIENDIVILEIKYDQFMPDWLKGIFLGARYQRCAMSKYCLSRII